MDHEEFLSTLNDNLLTKPVDELKNEAFSSGVASGKVKFLAVVESLQGVLTNENVTTREKGIEFLSWLLKQLPKELFNYSEISVLVNFFCDCLKGHHNFLPAAIRGLLELVNMKEIKRENIVQILVNMFQQINCQSQLQSDRFVLYSVLKQIITNHLEDVKEMGPDFVFGVISFIEGEADPFCLILIFNFLPIFLKNFDLGHLNEEMFELLSCYFPVDFNPLATENLTVTREDLAESLHRCLAATSSFSEQSIPLILEKVDSTFKNAKLDSYKLLQECCQNLSIENIEKYISPLWKNLSKDILPGNDKEVCQFGLSALSDIIHLLSKDESQQTVLKNFVDDIITTVRSLTNRIDENMFQPAIKVLVAAASRSKPATLWILRHLKTFSQLEFTSSLREKKTILSCFLPFMKICHEFKISECEGEASYLELIALYLDAVASDDFETRKLGYLGIFDILPDSSQEFRKKLLEILSKNIKTKDDVRTSEEFLKVWRNLAQDCHSELFTLIRGNQTFDSDVHFSNFLWALSLIEDLPKWTNEVVSYHLDIIFRDGNCFYVALETFSNACKFAKTNDSIDFFHALHSHHNVIRSLISWCQPKLKEEKIVGLVSKIIALVTRYQNPQAQQNIVDEMGKMLLGEGFPLNGSEETVPLTDQQINQENVENVLILEAVLGSVRPEITIPLIWTLRTLLMNLALNSADDSVRLSSSRLLASFVNKAQESISLDLLNGISKDIFAYLDSDRELNIKLNAAFLFTWIIKGVVLRGDYSSEECISTWFSLLGRTDVGEVIAERFQTVIEEDELYLNMESHCNVKLLYRQRLFGNYPKLLKMYEMADPTVKMNYLVATVRLFQGVPIHVIQMEISSIITILVRCLDADKPEVLTTSLEILTALLESKEKIFSDYIQSFVPKLLKLATLEGHLKIRINALKCLYFYGFYPTISLLPLKSQVIRDLEFCLDDRKRLARKEAVRARCRWFLVGAPGEDILTS